MSISDDPAHDIAPLYTHTRAIRENGVPSNVPSAAWHSRGYLPHFESSEATQHVTFHLADSLPQIVLQRLKSEPRATLDAKREAERRKRLEGWLDAGYGSCLLRSPKIAAMVQESLLAFDAHRYRLLAWVVMPNHVHALFQPIDGWTVAKIVASWKKFTARQIRDHHRQLGEPAADPVWHREYWDRYIRNEQHLARVIDYIHSNPARAGLASNVEHWPWCSAHPGNANLPIGVSTAPSSR